MVQSSFPQCMRNLFIDRALLFALLSIFPIGAGPSKPDVSNALRIFFTRPVYRFYCNAPILFIAWG
jgi:hypothetical protein